VTGAIDPLGPRLRALAERVLAGRPVADLCCDHAKLAAALVGEGRVPSAIAADVNADPLAAAAERIAALGLSDRVELRQGDGATVLAAGEVGTVVIAGIGAPLAERLVVMGEAGGHLVGVERLLVQANHGFPKLGALRATLDRLGWGIADEVLVVDQGRLYPIVVCERGQPGLADEVDRELGPILRRRIDPLANAWFARERARISRALVGMDAGAADPEQQDRCRRFLAAIDRVAASVAE
jgi:tRNA (adenine22-N1)-methyltransferase